MKIKPNGKYTYLGTDPAIRLDPDTEYDAEPHGKHGAVKLIGLPEHTGGPSYIVLEKEEYHDTHVAQ